jgi:NAD(P)-dependent dehydrogenase (short-subunit alcohol dehydrogenase family)
MENVMTGRLDGKVALVTGAGSGIGRATAIMMAAEGAKVVVSNRSEHKARATAQTILDAGGDAIALPADLTDHDQVKALIADAVAHYGRIDIAFNNAGIEGPPALTGDYDPAAWDQVMAVNLTGVFLCMKYELEQMQKQGSGSIVNCSSILGTVGFRTASAYVAAKHGVIGLTKTAALEYAPQGIRVNAVCPGFIDTPMIDRADSKMDTDLKAQISAMEPVGRMGTSEEIAEAVVYLASDGAAFTTGISMLVDGGYVAQ